MEIAKDSGMASKKSAEDAETSARNDGKETEKNQLTGKNEQESNEHYQIGEITVTGKIKDEATENMPAVVESLTAESIERINAVETSDVFKYMPGSYLRKLYPGATNSPLAIRGNNTNLTARTQVLVDGMQISDFTAAGNSNAPKWFMVAPQEIEYLDVIYGPFSAALSGNSMSGTAMITTHFPEKMEAQVDAKYFYQNFKEYNTNEDLKGYDSYVSFGDKLGNISFNAWYNRLDTQTQPITYMTQLVSAGGAPVGKPVTGWTSDSDPTGKPRIIIGTTGVQDLTNNTFKVKLASDLTSDSQLKLICALWDSEGDYDTPETYLRDAGGNPIYSGKVDIGGKSYTLSPSTFTYSKRYMQDLLSGLTYSLDSPGGLKLTSTVSSYQKLSDITRTSGTTPPAAESGGKGTVTDSDSGWYTADLKAAYDVQSFGVHTLGAGYHFNHYSTDSEQWNTSDCRNDTRTTLNLESEGKTQTNGLFVEDSWKIEDHWSVYLGGRYEWWKGFDGSKSTDASTGGITTELKDRNEDNFSPKVSTTFKPNEDWRLRLSLALATRYPTVGELFYGGYNSQGIVNNANPDLKPEKSFAKDFSITRVIGRDSEARLSFFEDDIEDAIYSQTNYYTSVTNYQNVDEVRTRGVELAWNKRRVFIDGLGLFTNVAWTDSVILRNDNVPKSVGKSFPRVPDWRAKCVLDYAPSDRWALTFAGHYASKQFANLDNSDTEGGYGGIDDFLIFDTKFSYRIHKNWSASLGVDNITDEIYHVSHPYPRRTVFAELKWVF
ncbi:MAG: TonB-dependent receptor [Pseudomonadota bacterium]